MRLNKSYYLENGFEIKGTILKDSKIGKKTYNTYVKWNHGFQPKNKIGVYIICCGDSVCKIGQSRDLNYRFQCYESHTGKTNVKIRSKLNENQIYEVLFLECSGEEVLFGGVKVLSGVYYQLLEKQLLIQFKENNPKEFENLWNEGLS